MKDYNVHHNKALNLRKDSIDQLLILIDQLVINSMLVTKNEL